MVTTVYGTVNQDDMAEYLTFTLRGVERWCSDEVVQSRGAVRVSLTPNGVKRLAHMVEQARVESRPRRIAVVVRRGEGGEFHRVLQALEVGSIAEMRVVASHREALCWLRPSAD